MADTPTLRSVFTAIANAIRAKTGGSATYKPTEMAAAISALNAGGGALVQGESSVLSGVFTLNTTETTYEVTLPQSQQGAPYIILLWAMLPLPYDGTAAKPYIVGAVLNTVCRSVNSKVTKCHTWCAIGTATSDNTALLQGNFASIRLQSGKITFVGNQRYPLRSGVQYCWEARFLQEGTQ